MRLLDHTSNVWRNADLGTNGRKQLQQLHSGVRCLFVPMNGPAAISNQFTVGKGFTAFFDVSADVRAGDRLVWDGRKYMVKAVMRYQPAIAALRHLRVLCEQENS